MLDYVIEAAALSLLLAPFLLRRWLAYIVVIPVVAGFHFFPWTTGIITGAIVVFGVNRLIDEALGGKEANGPGKDAPSDPSQSSATKERVQSHIRANRKRRNRR